MTLYQYAAYSKKSKKISGTINAESLEIAKEKLHLQHILVTKIFEIKPKKNHVVISQSTVITLTKDLSLLLKSGIALYESLQTLEEKYRAHKAHPLLLDLCDKIKHGMGLSFALSAYPKVFDQIYISMVKAGEESGALEKVFDRLAVMISKKEKLKKQLSSAMIYPAFIGIFCLVVLIALFFFLIPSMEELFEGRDLHSMTKTVLSISHFLSAHKIGFLIGSFILILGNITLWKSKMGKVFVKKALLYIPVCKTMVTEVILLRFSSVLSNLLGNGISLMDALHLSKKVMDHPSFEEAITQAEKEITQGRKLSDSLDESGFFPKLFTRMLSTAEEVGNISPMLDNIAIIYEEDLDRSLSRFTTLLQPMLLLFLGVVVGIILLSVLLPLTDVSSFMN